MAKQHFEEKQNELKYYMQATKSETCGFISKHPNVS